MPQGVVAQLLVNLEDDNIMRDIAKGKYDTFSPFDSSQFNDEYETVVRDLRLDKYMTSPEIQNIDKFTAFLKSNGITMLTGRRAYSQFNASEIDAYTDSKGTQRAEKNFNLMKQKKNQIGTFLRNLLNTKQKIAIILSKDDFGDAFVSLVSNPKNPGSGGDEYFYL
jgi:ATP sulfurylase